MSPFFTTKRTMLCHTEPTSGTHMRLTFGSHHTLLGGLGVAREEWVRSIPTRTTSIPHDIHATINLRVPQVCPKKKSGIPRGVFREENSAKSLPECFVLFGFRKFHPFIPVTKIPWRWSLQSHMRIRELDQSLQMVGRVDDT